MIIEPIGLLSL